MFEHKGYAHRSDELAVKRLILQVLIQFMSGKGQLRCYLVIIGANLKRSKLNCAPLFGVRHRLRLVCFYGRGSDRVPFRPLNESYWTSV